jgi:cell shape-determining protein MreC
MQKSGNNKMELLEQQLKRIQEKLQQVLKEYASLQKENIQLRNELDQTKQNSLQNIQTTDQLKQQVEVLKISSGNWDAKDKKEFEKRINQYIKDIDRCIALLGE